jgi:hypothetical protein
MVSKCDILKCIILLKKTKKSAVLNHIFLLLSMLITKYAENKICDRGEYFQSSTIRVVLLIY